MGMKPKINGLLNINKYEKGVEMIRDSQTNGAKRMNLMD